MTLALLPALWLVAMASPIARARRLLARVGP